MKNKPYFWYGNAYSFSPEFKDMNSSSKIKTKGSLFLSDEEIISDYKLAKISREVSLIGRKDVFMGRAKFGIFGDGKELAQVCMAKVFRKGDYRSGYYRDQTFMAAIGEMTWKNFFAQLYAHADINYDIFSAGKSMNAHFCNNWLDDNGEWLKLTDLKNSVMDVSSTAGQMPRSIGLGYASKLYRATPELDKDRKFSNKGNEVCFVTIGDASTSQGMFFESINAAGVLQIPLIVSVWDDGYGISVPKEYQTTKESISAALEGFRRTDKQKGIEIIKVKGWDYEGLIKAYEQAALLARDEHVPVLVHVDQMTQPQGHSASGSHERYKDKERLKWESDWDCIQLFRKWIIDNGIAQEETLDAIDEDSKLIAKKAREESWNDLKASLEKENKPILDFIKKAQPNNPKITSYLNQYKKTTFPRSREGMILLKKSLRFIDKNSDLYKTGLTLLKKHEQINSQKYQSKLYSESANSPLNVQQIKPKYSEDKVLKAGWEIINLYFDQLFQRRKDIIALGEDIGKIGDVNQGFAGLQEKHGELRITDTGIRETTIIGQGIGASMRGFRPIVEVQYFDYIYYCLSVLTDDLASLRYRSHGQQMAPLIVRTRGHRLEGIWHSGSPMAVMLNALRGMHVLVPRNFVKAAAFYNTLLKGDDPALIIECLNGYRQKEFLPENLRDICEPLGKVEILEEGTDLTLVTYGSMCRIAQDAVKQLKEVGISVELIDAQCLLPFDLEHDIAKSVKKTNRVIFADEDMPGGGSAYMLQQFITEQKGYFLLDSEPVCISAKANRPPYGSDGDYFTKPNAEDLFDAVYAIMHEAKPERFN